ncbi:phenylpyruvate tautomerase PptA (4-oxalocrotonate tautomerase family) [Marmoricola sp. URHA0025 HA25]
MTVITVNTPSGRLSLDQRRTLARTLTDAVLVPEIGRDEPAARVGFQVHFVERDLDHVAIGGILLADMPEPVDLIHVDVAVMDADWGRPTRADVIERILAAMSEALGLIEPSPAWWVNFRVIDDGSWASSGGVLSILDLLDTGVFSTERASAIRAALGV